MTSASLSSATRDVEKSGASIDPGAEEIEATHNSQIYSIDPAEERRVVRKLDTVIMPVMALVYLFQYIDKQAISQAAIFGLTTDLKLSGVEFSWAVSLFYVGQLVAEYPTMFLLSRLPVTSYVGISIVLWGAVNMAMGSVHNWHGLAAARFFLGFTEGAVSPAFIIITSLYYKRTEHPLRTATWLSMSGVSQIVGALMMYGIGHSNMSLAPWRAFFIIAGGLTAALGVLFVIVMPRDTKTAWFLTERERQIASQRLVMDRGTRDRKDFNIQQAKETFLTPTTWIYFLWALCLALTTPILKFNASVINGFGYNKFQTMLVGLPGGLVNFCTVWVGALVPRFFPNARTFTGMGLCLVPLTGAVLLIALPSEGYDWGIVVGTWMGACSAALVASAASIIASNVKGNTKKSVVSTGFFISFCVGCIVSPQAWTADQAPRYTKGCILSVVSLCVSMCGYVVYRILASRENKKRDAKLAAGQAEYSPEYIDPSVNTTGDGIDIDSDLTEIQDLGFRYIL
ncbi:major facilitator superfamily domain-containing protein [Mariannaea sp. PMI_226]|nr:major facilitator superfamily domain-containing protein [Mariannaea sp. PMI_226]